MLNENIVKVSTIQLSANSETGDEGRGNLNNDEQSLQSELELNSTATAASVVIKMPPIPIEEPAVPPNLEKDVGKKLSGKRVEKRKEEVTYKTHLTSLAHVSVVLFVYLILKLAFRGEFEFFTWHPILMAVGWMLLMTEGLFAINKNNTYWRLKTKGGFRVQIHVAILAIGYVLSIAGFVIVYINKENKGKHHFISWHALFGLIGLICTCPPVINGTALWYKKELSISKPRLVKFFHVLSGTLAFSFGALALVLSVYTKWFARKSDQSQITFYFGLIAVTYPLVWAVYGPSVKLVNVIKDYFMGDKED
ncbi:uncharacterized protein LOC109542890 [Dendroctonus ponderosae]